MRNKTLTKISIVLNVVFICGIFFLAYMFYPKLKQKFFPNASTTIIEKGLKASAFVSIVYHDAADFKIFGQLPYTKSYSRLPQEAKNDVKKTVWKLSQNSAGISARFTSNTTTIKLRWSLKENTIISNMTPIASKGFDLYTYINNKWQFVGVAQPSNSIKNEDIVIKGMEKVSREYLLNFPLYEGVDLIEIGVDQDAYIKESTIPIIDSVNPIIFYGTSITQGASASRPGLTYPSLIQRGLNKEVINLGFSGNGKFEKEIAKYFMLAKPSAIILDCTPNSSAETIRTNLPNLIEYIRSLNDTIPLVLIESIIFDNTNLKKDNKTIFGTLSFINEQNKALNDIYSLKSKKHKNLYYLNGENLIGNDHEATIDGIHFNDLGHFRAYEKIKLQIEKIIDP
jgi:lysophospholipase L1-like esterase